MNSDSQNSISVFGSTGFVGSSFCRNSTSHIIRIPRESRTPQSDQILYLISTTDNYNVFEDIHLDVNVNIQILLDVLKNLTPQKHVINFVSSWFVYGEGELPAKEDQPCNPKGFYSITKLAAEQLLKSYCETFGIQYRILRLCNVYGPGDKGVSKKKNAMQFLIEEIKNNRPINLYHNGEFYRDYMHVDDVARAIDLCIQNAPLNTTFNIGSGEKLLFKDLIKNVIELTQSQSIVGTMAPPSFHQTVQVKDFYMDTSKLKSLGFKPKISIQEGLKQLCL